MRRVVLIVVSALVMLVASFGVANAGNPTQDRFVARDQSTRFGWGDSTARHGDDLAWGEDGFLRSYFHLYTSTGDQFWLDKIVEHSDRILASAYDHDGDGSEGWPDLKLAHQQLANLLFATESPLPNAVNLVNNGGFEDGSATPTGWQQVGPMSTSRSTDPGDVFAGNAGALVTSNGTNQSMLLQQLTYVPGARYAVEAFAGIDEGDTQAIVEIFNASTNQVIGTTMAKHAGFERYGFTFVAPASGTVQIRLRLNKYIRDDWRARFDDVSVRALPPTADSAAACPDGVGGSATLVCTDAWGWTRDNTTLDYAHRTNDPDATGGKPWVMQLLGGGPTTPTVSQPILNYAPGSEYGFSALVQGSAGLRVVDTTTGTVLTDTQFPATSTFTRRFVYFDTPASGHDLRAEIYLTDNTSSGRASLHDLWLGQLWEQQLHEGNIYTPILWFANAVLDDPALVDYKAKAESYVAFAAQNLVHKWDPHWRQVSGVDGQNNGAGVYVMPPGFSNINSPGRSLPPNQFLSYGRILYLLHDATKGDPDYATERPFYLSRANDLNRLFKQSQRVHPQNPNAYLWSYSEGYGPWDDARYTSPTFEDAGHAMLTMAGVMESYQYGQVWTRDDMQKFVATWNDVMFNGNFTTPMFLLNNAGTAYTETGGTGIGAYVKFAEINTTSLQIADARERAYGGLAAQYSQLYRNKAINTQFEWQLLIENNLPAYWTPTGTGMGITRVANGTQLGNWALKLDASGSAPTGVEQTLPVYDEGTPYLLQVRGRATSGAITAELYDYTTNTSLGSIQITAAQWQEQTVEITSMPTQAGHDIRARVTTTGSAVVDEVRAFPAISRSQIPNSDFETSVRGTPTRPENWTISGTTTWADATLDTATFHSGQHSLRLTNRSDNQPTEIIYDWRGYQPDMAYTATGFGKTNGSTATVTITDLTTGTQLAAFSFSTANWTEQIARFRTPLAHDHILRISIRPEAATTAGTNQFWIDDLALFRTLDPVLRPGQARA